MFTARIEFRASANSVWRHEEGCNKIDCLLLALYRNGQLSHVSIPSARLTNGVDCYLSLPKEDSLSHEYNNLYVNEALIVLKQNQIEINAIAILGEEYDAQPACRCLSPKYYLLYTSYASTRESPLICCDCFKPVPLYRISKTYDDGYGDILGWRSNYQACDRLQMNCTVGDRFGVNQLTNPDSPLSEQGREICREMERLISVPVYYHLLNPSAIGKKVDPNRLCPVCANEWRLTDILGEKFYFRCDNCRLIS